MAACNINGKVCTKCCQAIHVQNQGGHLKRIMSGEVGPAPGDERFVAKYWRQISPEVAEYINPWPWQDDEFVAAADDERILFFRCTQLTESGCGAYDHRPHVCRAYPEGLSAEIVVAFPTGEYADGCPPWLEEVERAENAA